MSEGKKNVNILKVRDDRLSAQFQLENGEQNKYTLLNSQDVNWCAKQELTRNELRSHIEPWLTSLFQSEHLSLLVGSGLTTAVEYLACGKTSNWMSDAFKFKAFESEINKAAKESAVRAGRIRSTENANLEDQMRVANELVRGLSILSESSLLKDIRGKIETLRTGLRDGLEKFTNGVLGSEHTIAIANKRDEAFNRLVLFLMSFASRTGTRDRLNIFTTNYDRLIEAGADVAGLRLIDRFVGCLSPVFRASRMDVDLHYNPPGIRGEPRFLEGVSRFTKLHGSLDWIAVDGDIRRIGLPFGAKSIKPFLETAGLNADYSSLMVYPNSAKDRETAEYPYVELFRDLAAALCRPNSTLVTYGYSFGDDHINRVIRDMLTIPSTHLVIISYDDIGGRILEKYKQWGRQSQMSLIIGHDIANISDLVDCYLPKPSIDRASLKMADLLRQRFTQPPIPTRENGVENGQ